MRIVKQLAAYSLIPALSLGIATSVSSYAEPAQANPGDSNDLSSPTAVNEEIYILESDYDEYMRLGFEAQQDGDYAIAANYFRYALFAVPNDQEATTAYWNARAQLQTGEPTGRALLYNNNMEAGYDATDDSDYQVALSYFSAALELRPGDYYATQAVRNVRTYLSRGALADSPSDVPATYIAYENEPLYDRYMRLGYAAVQREDFDSAREYFRSALSDRPNDRTATVAYWNAVDAMQDGEFGLNETAETRYDRFMRRGYDATERGNYAQALRLFQRALEERPRDGYAAQAIVNVRTYMQ